MIYKVSIESQIQAGMSITHSWDQMVETDEDARAFGRECVTLFQAWQEGFQEVEIDG